MSSTHSKHENLTAAGVDPTSASPFGLRCLDPGGDTVTSRRRPVEADYSWLTSVTADYVRCMLARLSDSNTSTERALDREGRGAKTRSGEPNDELTS